MFLQIFNIHISIWSSSQSFGIIYIYLIVVVYTISIFLTWANISIVRRAVTRNYFSGTITILRNMDMLSCSDRMRTLYYYSAIGK